MYARRRGILFFLMQKKRVFEGEGLTLKYTLFSSNKILYKENNFFFKPSPAVPVLPPYTYLLEVKYAKAGASDKEIRTLADDAREQLIRYSKDECVAEARGKGGLKLITVVWRSWELALTEEI